MIEALRQAGAHEAIEAMRRATQIGIEKTGSLKVWASANPMLASVGAGLSTFIDYAFGIAKAVIDQRRAAGPSFPGVQVVVATTTIAGLTFVTILRHGQGCCRFDHGSVFRVDYMRLENGDLVRDYTGMGGGGGSTFP